MEACYEMGSSFCAKIFLTEELSNQCIIYFLLCKMCFNKMCLTTHTLYLQQSAMS